jgi:hypothetical protein
MCIRVSTCRLFRWQRWRKGIAICDVRIHYQEARHVASWLQDRNWSSKSTDQHMILRSCNSTSKYPVSFSKLVYEKKSIVISPINIYKHHMPHTNHRNINHITYILLIHNIYIYQRNKTSLPHLAPGRPHLWLHRRQLRGDVSRPHGAFVGQLRLKLRDFGTQLRDLQKC